MPHEAALFQKRFVARPRSGKEARLSESGVGAVSQSRRRRRAPYRVQRSRLSTGFRGSSSVVADGLERLRMGCMRGAAGLLVHPPQALRATGPSSRGQQPTCDRACSRPTGAPRSVSARHARSGRMRAARPASALPHSRHSAKPSSNSAPLGPRHCGAAAPTSCKAPKRDRAPAPSKPHLDPRPHEQEQIPAW